MSSKNYYTGVKEFVIESLFPSEKKFLYSQREIVNKTQAVGKLQKVNESEVEITTKKLQVVLQFLVLRL